MENKIKLYGLNNLTKTLNFNKYDTQYTEKISDKDLFISNNGLNFLRAKCDMSLLKGSK